MGMRVSVWRVKLDVVSVDRTVCVRVISHIVRTLLFVAESLSF